MNSVTQNGGLEIAAPAGDLASGLYALKAGADAVYFGLAQFSARKGATNLSISDARRLKAFAGKQGSRIYAAINTVISQEELPKVLHWVRQLALMEVDAIIIQDLGLAALIREHFPNLSIHGSTQLGVHNRIGLAAAHRLGLSRVVLSRELSLTEISNLKTEFPHVDREVFVHGALCYGFSGLCLASDIITGRSGNRGECAQICRTWFERDNQKGYYLSCRDLDAGEHLEALSKAGVVSIKIEGRMKSPAYCFHTTAYYRALIDGDSSKTQYHRTRSALCFSRPKSSGFLTHSKNNSLTNPTFPSHVGVPGAKILEVRKDRIRLRALTRLRAHDKLMRLPVGPQDEGEVVPLSRFEVKGKHLTSIETGEVALIPGIPCLNSGNTGTVLKKTVAGDMTLKSISPNGYPPHKTQLPLFVARTDSGLKLGTQILGRPVHMHFDVPIESLRKGKPFDQVLATLFESYKEYPFTLGRIEPFTGQPQIEKKLFVPPSALKKIRNQFFSHINQALTGQVTVAPPSKELTAFDYPLPIRTQIVYPDGFPFLLENTQIPADQWPQIDGVRYLSLPPVMFHPDKTLCFLSEQIERHPKAHFAVGLNNVGHLTLLRDWIKYDNVVFYIDYGLYAANTQTLCSIHRMGKVRGAYLWLEANSNQRKSLEKAIRTQTQTMPPGIRFISDKEIFPMFISRICVAKTLSDGECPTLCSRTLDFTLLQRRTPFEAKVRDCISYLFASKPPL